jgi:hypothetical protein
MTKSKQNRDDLPIDIKKFTARYTEMYAALDGSFKELQEAQFQFPQAFVDSEKFEEWTLIAANCKHRALDLSRRCVALNSSVDIDGGLLTANVLLNEAEAFLKDRGFERATDSLREAVVSHNKDLAEFMKLKGRIKALFEAAGRLHRAFETDETNFRVFAGYKNRASGF